MIQAILNKAVRKAMKEISLMKWAEPDSPLKTGYNMALEDIAKRIMEIKENWKKWIK